MSKYLELLRQGIDRHLKGRPKSWLSRQSGIPESTISRIMKGEREPGFESVMKVANAFGCSVDDLIGSGDSKEDLVQKVGKLTMEIDRLRGLLKAQAAKPRSLADLEKSVDQVTEQSREARKTILKSKKKL